MKNALICFLKFPEPGHVKTRLAVDLGAAGAAELYEAMAERIITEVYPLENDYDLFLFVDPAHEMQQYEAWIGASWALRAQSHGDLGQRMEAAVGWAFEAGYEKVAVIGTDCIGMDQSFMEEKVFAKLDDVDYVLGPSTDGGYYLLAMKAVSPWLFTGVEWSTNSVLDTTIDKIEMRDLEVFELDERIDVDDMESLLALKESLPKEHFLVHKIEKVAMDRVSLGPEAHKFFNDESPST